MDAAHDENLREDEEEVLVYVEFEDCADANMFSNKQLHFDMIGLDTDHPIMQVNGRFFEGTYEDAVGTYMFFDKNDNPVVEDPVFDLAPSLNYFARTRKLLKMQRVFVKHRTEVIGDSEHGDCVPNVQTLREAGVPVKYQQEALDFWNEARNSRMTALSAYLEKQRIREEKKSLGIAVDSESDEDNPFAVYNPKTDPPKQNKSKTRKEEAQGIERSVAEEAQSTMNSEQMDTDPQKLQISKQRLTPENLNAEKSTDESSFAERLATESLGDEGRELAETYHAEMEVDAVTCEQSETVESLRRPAKSDRSEENIESLVTTSKTRECRGSSRCQVKVLTRKGKIHVPTKSSTKKRTKNKSKTSRNEEAREESGLQTKDEETCVEQRSKDESDERKETVDEKSVEDGGKDEEEIDERRQTVSKVADVEKGRVDENEKRSRKQEKRNEKLREIAERLRAIGDSYKETSTER